MTRTTDAPLREGTVTRLLAGFYTVDTGGGETVSCRARGRFRMDGKSPLVGDRVRLSVNPDGSGYLTEIMPRRNFFLRPAVANVDCLVLLAAAVNPITDPFLIDRVAAIAESRGVGVIVVINKCSLDRGDALFEIYSGTGYPTLRTDALTGEGVSELRAMLAGRTAAFTGNSGVGKSSLLNALSPGLSQSVGEVSERLGRGRHTTRCVTLFDIGGGTLIADTPGFSSFDLNQTEHIAAERLQYLFPEFAPFLGQCRFDDCAHIAEPGCAVLDALHCGKIAPSRHASYARLHGICSAVKDWERKSGDQIK